MILRDPVHDLVAFDAEEEAIVPALLSAIEVQRLRRIRQLGATSLVFPGAEHSRFTHAVGAAHVMTRLVRRLREIHDALPFWQRLASDRAQDALAAALLHDLGHGPYSHLFEEAIPGALPHEVWSLRIVRDPSTEVNRILAARDSGLPERVASLIAGGKGAAPYPLRYLSHAVSGTFDVDRCDYLLRDAHMTGVRYGLFDLDWLLRSLRLAPVQAESPAFAIDGLKGLPAIEGFIIARRFMFEQVYLHKATRAAEVLIKAIFERARRVLLDGTSLPNVPEAVAQALSGKEPTLGAYLALDDVAVEAAFVSWEKGPDPVLADLCLRLRARRIGKTIELFDLPPERVEALVADAREITAQAGLDPEFHVAIDVAEDGHGTADDAAGLDVILADGTPRPLSEASSLIGALLHAPVRRVRLVVPPEVRDRVAAAGRASAAVP